MLQIDVELTVDKGLCFLLEFFWFKSMVTKKKQELNLLPFIVKFPEGVLQRCSHKMVIICSKFIEHPYQIVISVKVKSSFIEITFRHGCSPVNFLHIFRTPLSNNTTGGLLLNCVIWFYTVLLTACFIHSKDMTYALFVQQCTSTH